MNEIVAQKIIERHAANNEIATTFQSYLPVSGGDIHQAFKLQTSGSAYFLKCSASGKHPSIFEKEAKGLELLSAAMGPYIPSVLDIGQAGGLDYLLMEFVESGHIGTEFWETFGAQLAKMHQCSADQFGLDHDNFIGSLIQCNEQRSDWITFYVEMRLEKQLKLAMDAGLFQAADYRSFQKLYEQLDRLMPAEKPALLHGDLWSGNYLCTKQGEPCIFDPAVYFGHREIDLAMMHLFGGFDSSIYTHYEAHYPLENGWKERLPLFQLYPLMVHVNQFGGHYVNSVRSIVRSFV